MATLEELVVILTAETSQLKAEVSAASKAVQVNTEKMDKAVEEFSSNSSKNTSFFQQAMATMAGVVGSQLVIGAFGLLKDAAGALADEFVKGMNAANAEELALTKLANSMALSGQYTTESMKSLQDFASEMEALTNVGDDVVANNLSILSSLTKLDAEGLKTAQKSALDMSAALGIDLESATRLVGKAVNGQTEALKRYGISVDEGSSKSERLTNITKALSNMQGSAGGATQNFQGILGRIANTWGNITEVVGAAITRNKAVVEVLKVVSDTLTDFQNSANGSSESLKELVANGLIVFIQTTAYTVQAIDVVIKSLEALYHAAQTIANGLGTVLLAPFALFSDNAEMMLESFAQGTVETFNKIGESVSKDSNLSSFADKLMEMSAAAKQGLDQMKQGANDVIEPTVAVGGAVAGVTEEITKQQEKLKESALAYAEIGASQQAAFDAQFESLKANKERELVTQAEYAAAFAELTAANQAWEQEQLQSALDQKLISEQDFYNARIGLAYKHMNEQRKVEAELSAAKKKELEVQQQNYDQTMGKIAGLANSSNKELAAIGKAAAITQATIDGYAAVQKALASAPPPFNFALAGIVGAATAANVAKISGVALAEGGIVRARPGGIQATIGEGGNDEAVIPLNDPRTASRLSGIMGGGSTEIVLSLKGELMDFIEAQLIERGRLGLSVQGV